MRELGRETEFLVGLGRIVKACRQEVDEATLEVYTEALCYQVDPQEWQAFTRKVVATGLWSWFPKVSDILDALREFRGQGPLLAEANEAYERVMNSAGYSPECGAVWTYRGVKESCGPAAAEAFLAAGAHHAFAITWDEAKRREKFIAAYQSAVRADQTLALPAPQVKQLPGGNAEPLSRDDAARICQKLEKAAEPYLPKQGPKQVSLSPEREALLKQQAEEITK